MPKDPSDRIEPDPQLLQALAAGQAVLKIDLWSPFGSVRRDEATPKRNLMEIPSGTLISKQRNSPYYKCRIGGQVISFRLPWNVDIHDYFAVRAHNLEQTYASDPVR